MVVKPVLVQSQKVTIVAGGAIDLRTEELGFDFNTRPRKGIGVSAGMFANLFISRGRHARQPEARCQREGGDGGAPPPVATGGRVDPCLRIFDRVRAAHDLCKESREQAAGKR